MHARFSSVRTIVLSALALGAAAPSRAQDLAWTECTKPGDPSGRGAFAMAYDAARGEIVLFGGLDSDTVLADTWTWADGAWRLESPATSPPARGAHAMAYDSARQKVILFGGFSDSSAAVVLEDTWEWDGVTWTEVTPVDGPSRRFGHTLSPAPGGDGLVLFGGWISGGSPLDDTWTWDGSAWTRVVTPVSPPPRAQHVSALDSTRGRLVIYGGVGASAFTDTWEFDGSIWTPSMLPGGPGMRIGSAMEFDPSRGRCVLFGGGGNPGDTWEWDGASWAPLGPLGAPAARADSEIVYEPSLARLILFGGLFPGTYHRDTWQLAQRAAHGTVVGDAGIGYPVLFLNGVTSGPCFEPVEVAVGASLSVDLRAARFGPNTEARYVLWMWRGGARGLYPVTAGGATIGFTVAPTPLQPIATPQPTWCLRGGVPSRACRGLAEAMPSPATAPFSLVRAGGFTVPLDFTMQGLIEDASSLHASGFSVTNPIIARIR